MKVTQHLAEAKDTIISFEILPPAKGKSIESIYSHLNPLMEFNPAFINVTYHRAESRRTVDRGRLLVRGVFRGLAFRRMDNLWIQSGLFVPADPHNSQPVFTERCYFTSCGSMSDVQLL